jgi:hypothetical protein
MRRAFMDSKCILLYYSSVTPLEYRDAAARAKTKLEARGCISKPLVQHLRVPQHRGGEQ